MRYSAFISYNFVDKKWAQWLHRGLEYYRVPKYLRGSETRYGVIERKLRPVFRDRDELAAGADLAQAVQQALSESQALIVICSPRSAQSRWVNEEIRVFRKLGRGDRIFCLIVDGEPNSSDPEKNCFPPALTENGEAEPLAADLRVEQDGKHSAKLKLIASLLDVDYDQLRRREHNRRVRQLSLIAAASVAGVIVTGSLAVAAYLSRNEAIEQRNIAIERTVTAERTVDFVTGMFEVADPSEALGSTITARDIVDDAAERLRNDLQETPNVRVELGLTLSEVYASLGLFRQSDQLLAFLTDIPVTEEAVEVRRQLLRGESLFRAASYEDAIASLEAAVEAARVSPIAEETLLSRSLFALGQSYSAIDRFDEARTVLEEAVSIEQANGAEGRRDLARNLEGLALNEYYGGDLDISRNYLEQAIAIRLEEEGENSPSVSDNYNTLASIYYIEGDRDRAIETFRSRLAIDEAVLGENHPDVAITLNNIGRILVENRDFRDAEQSLERAVALIRAERGDQHDDLAFAAANLAMAQAALGQSEDAESSYRLALAAAQAHGHRNRGPIMADLGAHLCANGNLADGLAMISSGRPLMAEDYPDDPWRLAWMDASEGICLWYSGERQEARELIRAAREPIAESWDGQSYYGREIRRRAAMAGV